MKDVAPPRRGQDEHCQMQVMCPRCGGQGLVPWNRLDRILHCSACRAWSRLDRFGKPFEVPPPSGVWIQVRSSFSGWKRARVVLGQPETDDQREPAPLTGRTGLIIASGVAVSLLVVGGLVMFRPRAEAEPAAPASTTVPDSLEGRATVWANAWMARDTGQLLKLVEVARDRDLRRWLQKHPPPPTPGLPQATPADRSPPTVTSKPGRQPGISDVTLTIDVGRGSDTSGPTVLRQVWYQRDGVWYFWPE